MPRIAYVDGRYRPLSEPLIRVEDRGYQFADGVYEVYEVIGGRLADEERHLARLARSLSELRIAAPMSGFALGAVMREVVRRNRIRDGLLYLQVSRGVAPRNHAFPAATVRPVVAITARPFDRGAAEMRAETGIAVTTVPDIRWKRVDIKSVSLLPNVLAKQAAREAGGFEAWLIDGEGRVTEGSSSNAWIVTRDGELATAPTTAAILRGITRGVVIETAARHGLRLSERLFGLDEARSAKEAFITSATSLVTPVVRIDGQPVGDGRPGETARTLRRALRANPTLAAVLAGPLPASHDLR